MIQIDVLVEAKQHENTDAGWQIVAQEQIASGAIDQMAVKGENVITDGVNAPADPDGGDAGEKQEQGTINFALRNTDDNAGIAGVPMTLYKQNESAVTTLDSNYVPVKTIFSDDNGEGVFNGLEAGTYALASDILALTDAEDIVIDGNVHDYEYYQAMGQARELKFYIYTGDGLSNEIAIDGAQAVYRHIESGLMFMSSISDSNGYATARVYEYGWPEGDYEMVSIVFPNATDGEPMNALGTDYVTFSTHETDKINCGVFLNNVRFTLMDEYNNPMVGGRLVIQPDSSVPGLGAVSGNYTTPVSDDNGCVDFTLNSGTYNVIGMYDANGNFFNVGNVSTVVDWDYIETSTDSFSLTLEPSSNFGAELIVNAVKVDNIREFNVLTLSDGTYMEGAQIEIYDMDSNYVKDVRQPTRVDGSVSDVLENGYYTFSVWYNDEYFDCVGSWEVTDDTDEIYIHVDVAVEDDSSGVCPEYVLTLTHYPTGQKLAGASATAYSVDGNMYETQIVNDDGTVIFHDLPMEEYTYVHIVSDDFNVDYTQSVYPWSGGTSFETNITNTNTVTINTSSDYMNCKALLIQDGVVKMSSDIDAYGMITFDNSADIASGSYDLYIYQMQGENCCVWARKIFIMGGTWVEQGSMDLVDFADSIPNVGDTIN
jgi:hypothetical protein